MNNLFNLVNRDERQEQIRVNWIKNKCRGTLVSPTGFGKTRVALKCLKCVTDKYPKLNTLIIVPTETLKDQWANQLEEWKLNADVMIINSAIKHTHNYDILVIDEIHRIGADTFQRIFDCVDYKYILGLTATFERLDGKHTIIERYCPVFDSVSLLDAELNGWISKYKEYEVLINVDDLDVYKEYNKEFLEHFEFFNFDFSLAMSMIGPKGFINRARYRDEIYTGNDPSEKTQVFKNITYHAMGLMRTMQARKKFINNHPKKLELANKIIEARKDCKIITFSNNIKMAESIKEGQVYTGKTSKKKGRTTIEEFNKCDKGVLNTVMKADEGLDVKGLSVAIILGLNSSEIKSTQRKGRVIRKESDNKVAEIFNIIIDNTQETKWFSTAHKNDKSYIVIDEEGLEDVLNGKEPKPYKKKIFDFTYRY